MLLVRRASAFLLVLSFLLSHFTVEAIGGVHDLFRRRNSLDSNPIATQMLQDHERRLICLESDVARLQIQLSALEIESHTERPTREDFVSATSSLRRGQQNRPRPRVERLQSDTTTSRSPLRQ